jgi:hypothetical protein
MSNVSLKPHSVPAIGSFERILSCGLAIGLVAMAPLFTGCRTHYQVTLNNAAKFTSAGKPKLEQGFYVFEDAVSGEKVQIAKGKVVAIEALPAWGKSDKESKSSPRK